MVLALFGVSNGAIQFMTYEELKRWRQEVKRNRLGPGASEEEVKALVSYWTGYTDVRCKIGGVDELTCSTDRPIPNTFSCRARQSSLLSA